MSKEPVSIYYLYRENRDDIVGETIRALLDNGCRANSDGATHGWRVTASRDWDHVDSIEEVIDLLDSADSGRCEVWAERMPIEVSIDIETSRVPTGFRHVALSVSNLYFKETSHDDDRTRDEYLGRFLQLSNAVHRRTEPFCGYGFYRSPRIERYVPTEEQVITGDIDYPCWANYFSRRTVDSIGRETILSAPVHRTETLHDDSILLVVNQYPYQFPGADQDAVVDHLGLSLPT
ncbi:hypothetical protein ACFR9U_04615 [Halorientalis brevis]|uniref:Uncharacterized protein n=1 Tax=Halorientalis brevis TaxID=1126241 RepID=A0ABD6C8P8_9EURY|nr:hypothetical protein [Halorientalis brevis]